VSGYMMLSTNFLMKRMPLRGAQGEAGPQIAIPGEATRGGVPDGGLRPLIPLQKRTNGK
jgi:hypothetical protein